MLQYRYAMFDLDGTLVDTMKYWRNVMYECAQLKGITDLTEDIKENLQKMTCASGAEYIKSVCENKDLCVFTREDILSLMEYHYVNHTQLKVGVIELLEYLKSRGVKMCIVSATPGKLVNIALQTANISEYFEYILTTDDFPKGKQDAEIFNEVLRRFDSKPHETAVFEDAYYSIKNAVSLGFYVIGIEDYYERRFKDKIISLSDEYYENWLQFDFGKSFDDPGSKTVKELYPEYEKKH